MDKNNRIYGSTPAGGDYSELFYMNKKHEYVEPEEAEIGVIRECKEDGTLVGETWFMTKKGKAENA